MEHASGDRFLPLDDIADAARLLPGESGRATGPELPETYGRLRLVLMVKDPHSLFAYWEWTAAGGTAHAGDGREPDLWLRLYEADAPGHAFFPLEERCRVAATGRYHLRVPGEGRHYVARLEDGRGDPLLTSNVVATPPGRPAVEEEDDSLTREAIAHWFRLSASGPTSPGLFGEVRGSWLALGAGSSPAPQGREPWFLRHLEARVVVSDLPGDEFAFALRLQETPSGAWEASVVSVERRPRAGARGDHSHQATASQGGSGCP